MKIHTNRRGITVLIFVVRKSAIYSAAFERVRGQSQAALLYSGSVACAGGSKSLIPS